VSNTECSALELGRIGADSKQLAITRLHVVHCQLYRACFISQRGADKTTDAGDSIIDEDRVPAI